MLLLMTSSLYSAPKLWASIASRVHISATKYRQLKQPVGVLTCPNKCSSQSRVLFSLHQHTTLTLFFNLIDFNFFPTSSKSVEYLEMFTAILIAYKTIIFASTAPSDDDLPKLPLQVIQIQVHIFYLLVFETQNNSREEN